MTSSRMIVFEKVLFKILVKKINTHRLDFDLKDKKERHKRNIMRLVADVRF